MVKSKLLVFAFFFGCIYFGTAQTLSEISAPTLNVPQYACATPAFNSYDAGVSYSSPGFANDNIFYLEMSDANGSFSNPYTIAQEANQNFNSAWSFDFIGFALPEDVGGDNFKFRIRSTSPATVSEESNAYGYYWYGGENAAMGDFSGPNGSFQLIGSAVICEGSSKTLFIQPADYQEYRWYKDAEEIVGVTASSIEVFEEGIYTAEVYLGPCNLSIPQSITNALVVSEDDGLLVSILGDNNISICPGDTYTLDVDIDNPDYEYTWFKDGNIALGPGYFPALELSGTNADGTYYTEIVPDANSCVSRTQDVTVGYSSAFSVAQVSAPQSLLLPGEELSLQISTTATTYSVSWFRDGVEVPNSNSLELSVDATGSYVAQVTSTNGCGGILESDPFEVTSPTAYDVTIQTDPNYVPCDSNDVILVVESIAAITQSGSPLELDIAAYNLFQFQWFNQDGILNGETSESLTVQNPSTNGSSYYLEIELDSISAASNNLEIELGADMFQISAPSTVLCPNATVTIEGPLQDDYIYTWFKDGLSIPGETTSNYVAATTGDYTLEIVSNGCTAISNTISLSETTADELAISPGEDLYITEGVTQTLTASGGDSYTWLDATTAVISTNPSVVISEAGTYYLVSTIDGCEFQKEITVNLQDSLVGAIPNVITPNGDGINDRWSLPASYQNDNVEVTIYHSSGSQVLKTNNYQGQWPEDTNVSSMSSPVFYYVIKADNSIVKKGTVTVLK